MISNRPSGLFSLGVGVLAFAADRDTTRGTLAASCTFLRFQLVPIQTSSHSSGGRAASVSSVYLNRPEKTASARARASARGSPPSPARVWAGAPVPSSSAPKQPAASDAARVRVVNMGVSGAGATFDLRPDHPAA